MFIHAMISLLLHGTSLPAAPPDPPVPPAPPSAARIDALIADLKSGVPDPRPREAMYELFGNARLSIKPLQAALSSADYRQRQLAADTLRRIEGIGRDGDEPRPPTPPAPDAPPIKIEPTEALLKVCFEGLKNDTLPGKLASDREYAYMPIVFNAASGTRYLIKHADVAEPFLVEGLKSTDLQQRFCCAVALGFAGKSRHAAAVCKILIPHLRDNSIASDALWAACALYHLGPAADVHLQAAAVSPVDKQQGELLRLIILDISQPLKTMEEYGPRANGKLTTLDLDGSYDPIVWYTPDTLAMDWGDTMTEKNRDTPKPPPPPTPTKHTRTQHSGHIFLAPSGAR